MAKIIAEVCQNHMGDRKLLGDMIRSAAENGAHIVKMQSIFSSDLTDRERFEEGETDPSGKVLTIKRPHAPEFERLKKLDLTLDDHIFFIEECKKYGVIPMTTVFARGRVKEIGELPWPEKIIKVASYDCASYPLLTELSKYFDHFIVSTGASYDEEIKKASELLESLGKKLTFLHCVTSYPNTLEMANLERMNWLRQFTSSIGWSDHTLIERDKLVASKAALYLGAEYVERHFTVLEKDKTKDGPVSVTPALLRELREFSELPASEQKHILEREAPNWQICVGSPTRELTHTELLNRDYYRGRFATKTKGTWVYNWE